MKWQLPKPKNDVLEPLTLFALLIGAGMVCFMLMPLVLPVPERIAGVIATVGIILAAIIASAYSLYMLKPRLRGSIMDRALYVLLPLSLFAVGVMLALVFVIYRIN